jgi:hypothetical protein
MNMKSTCSFVAVPVALAAAFIFTACVDLTTPWSGRTDAALDGASAAGTGGTTTAAADAGAGGSGGSAATGGIATGGSAAGGTVGSGEADARVAIDATATDDTRESGAADTMAMPAVDAEALVDGVVFLDVAIDAPLFADANTPLDIAAEILQGTEAGTVDGFGTGGSDSSGVDAADGAGIDSARSPMIVSIDFVGGMPNGTASPSGTVVMAASETAGVKPATHWNSATGATGTLSSLVLAGGALTAASASWSMNPIDGAIDTWSNSFVDAPGDTRMMNGYLDPRSSNSPVTISVAGLPDPMNGGYDVYVYCYSNMDSPDTRVYEYTIGQTTYSVTQTGPSTSTFARYVEASGVDGGSEGAGNYVVFRHVTGSSFSLTALPKTSTYGMQRAPVNGMQIVYPSGT